MKNDSKALPENGNRLSHQAGGVHQYIDRMSRRVVTETLFADPWVRLMYHPVREHAPALFHLMTSQVYSSLVGWLNFDRPGLQSRRAANIMMNKLGIDMAECADINALSNARAVFERQIKFWDTRPMEGNKCAVASPADSRIITGSFSRTSQLLIKDKFFSLPELLGPASDEWHRRFIDGDFAVFRLTPDKYHYNHSPVSGEVVGVFDSEGAYNACHPDAVVAMATPFSKNRRVITIINSDVPGGTGVGYIAMVEVAALMIGGIKQCYCDDKYTSPQRFLPGIFMKKGSVKSLYRPGSSTDILLFEKDRITFSEDLVSNQFRPDAVSRFSSGFGQPLVETDVAVRSTIAYKKNRN